MFFGTILFLMLGFNFLAENFSPSALFLPVLFLAVSLSFLCLFLRQEKKEANPILDMALLRSRPFLATNIYNLVLGAGIFGIISFIPFYATSVHHLSTLVSGMVLTPRFIGAIPASAATSFLLHRWGYRRPIVLGSTLIALSIVFLAGQEFQLFRVIGIRPGTAEILASLILVNGIGIGIVLPPANNACIELMPEKVATISGLRGMIRSVGGAFAISIITIILHSSATPADGFRITFIAYGIALLLTLPLVLLMPSGKDRKGTN